MNRNEKFAVWDATHPQIIEVKEYLDRLCGKTPLNLVYKDGNDLIVTNQIKQKKLQQLVGILLNDETVLHLRAFTYDDAKPLFGTEGDIDTRTICTWVSSQMATFSNARPAQEADIKMLDRHKDKLKTTLEVLDYHGVKLPKFGKNGQVWLSANPDSVFCKHRNGESRLEYYLQWFCDILIFSTYH